jgi:hypothetical protein
MNKVLSRTLKLGIDIHAQNYRVAYREDEKPDPVEQEMSPEEFLNWVKTHVSQGRRIYSCYEAGPLDCTLHLDLKSLGVCNRLIRYRNRENGEDKLDPLKYSASELLDITCALA